MTYFPAACVTPSYRHHEWHGGLLVISAPDWFGRTDFDEWRRGTACWSRRRACYAAEYPDVFMTFDFRRAEPSFWEGSDADSMPDDVYRDIGDILRSSKFGSCGSGVIWLKP